MNTRHWYLLVILVSLLLAAFGVGLVMVSPNGGWLRSLPVVGKLVGRHLDNKQPELTPEVLTTPLTEGGIKKSVEDGGVVNYIISGRLLEDGFIRTGDGMMQGKLLIDGHLQSQPLSFVAGSMDGRVYFGRQLDATITYETRESSSIVGLLKKGKKVSLTMSYGPQNLGSEDEVLMLEDLLRAMKEHRAYEGDEPMSVYVLKLALMEI